MARFGLTFLQSSASSSTMLFSLALVNTQDRSTIASENEESALVARAVRGDQRAFDTLVRAHIPRLLTLATRLVGRRSDAEDIVQEALATAIAELPSLRSHTAFGGWLRTITVRQAHRYFRKRKLWRFFGLEQHGEDSLLVEQASPNATPEQRAQLAELDAVLLTLPGEQRIAWCLRYVEGETLEDVAVACGCSLATAKRWIAAAHAKIVARVQLEGAQP